MDRSRQMIAAVTNGNAAKVADLLHREPRLARSSTPEGEPMLHLAARHGAAEVVTALLAAGADPAATDAVGKTALQVAEAAGQTAVVTLLRG